jgi:zinc-finger binding domain of transposase IS66
MNGTGTGTCRTCGEQTSLIGYEESEQLKVEPARYFVLVTKREKRACTVCKEGGVVTAALPARIIDKSLASDRVIIANDLLDDASLPRSHGKVVRIGRIPKLKLPCFQILEKEVHNELSFATGRMESSARLLFSSICGCTRKRTSLGQSASV